MSSVNVVITKVSASLPHPNADTLRIYRLEGLDWQVVGKQDQYFVGDLVVYFPPDTVLRREWAESLGVANYLSFIKTGRYSDSIPVNQDEEWGRVRAIKLRGEPSYGFLTGYTPELGAWLFASVGALQAQGQDISKMVGINVSEYYSAKQYRPPGVGERGFKALPEDAIARPPWIPKYTDIENFRNYPSVISESETCVVTEKIHGTCAQLARHTYLDPDGNPVTEWYAGCGKGLLRKMPETKEERQGHWYWHIMDHPGVRQFFDAYAESHTVIVFGETFGPVQTLRYGQEKLAFRLFDVMVDGRFFDWPLICAIGAGFKIPLVPELYRGPVTRELLAQLATGNTTIGGGHIREGVVVHPLFEREDRRIGRVILKYINPEYLTGTPAAEEVSE
jgi:RNA ligase (TIGR02306 family)